MKIHRKIDVARAQLERSVSLFFDGDYYSAATLAGASEEILGKFIEKTGAENELKSLVRGTKAVGKLFGEEYVDKDVITMINEVRNWLKHFTDGEDLEFDSEIAAAELIDRASTNYYNLTGEETEGMRRFLASQIDVNNAHIRHRNFGAEC